MLSVNLCLSSIFYVKYMISKQENTSVLQNCARVHAGSTYTLIRNISVTTKLPDRKMNSFPKYHRYSHFLAVLQDTLEIIL